MGMASKSGGIMMCNLETRVKSNILSDKNAFT